MQYYEPFRLNMFLPYLKGGETNNIEEATIFSLFASGYETKVRILILDCKYRLKKCAYVEHNYNIFFVISLPFPYLFMLLN